MDCARVPGVLLRGRYGRRGERRRGDGAARCRVNIGEWEDMRAIRLLGGALLLMGGIMAADASAAEIKVLSAEAMKPALQELAATFEKESGNKVKVEYASAEAIQKKVDDAEDYDVVIMDQKRTDNLRKTAKVVGGSIKKLASAKDDVYVASSPMLTEQPVAAQKLIEFLDSPKAAEVYKAKGLQPG
jgi:ABC-type molybdate transport system substrate-binding protein